PYSGESGVTGVGAAGALAPSSGGSSLLPTMVRFRPICTGTRTPSTVRVVLALRYHPSEPVPNSLGSTWNSWSPIFTITGWAFLNWARVIGQLVFFAMDIPRQEPSASRAARQSGGIVAGLARATTPPMIAAVVSTSPPASTAAHRAAG